MFCLQAQGRKVSSPSKYQNEAITWLMKRIPNKCRTWNVAFWVKKGKDDHLLCTSDVYLTSSCHPALHECQEARCGHIALTQECWSNPLPTGETSISASWDHTACTRQSSGDPAMPRLRVIYSDRLMNIGRYRKNPGSLAARSSFADLRCSNTRNLTPGCCQHRCHHADSSLLSGALPML